MCGYVGLLGFFLRSGCQAGIRARVQGMVAISPALNPGGLSASAISVLLCLRELFIFLPSGAAEGTTWISKDTAGKC